MTRISINPWRVDWAGENPGIYLKADPGASDYCTLCLFYRVVLSPHGRGSAAIVLGAPDAAAGWPDAPNFLMTDNFAMMRWIVDGWVANLPAFKDRPGLREMTWLDCETVEKSPGDLTSRYSETLRGSGVTLELLWRDLGPPLPLEVAARNSATKEHDMYGVFLEARAADVRVNGMRLPGQVTERPFLGRTMSSAFLAFSETWVSPSEARDAAG